MRKEEDGVKIMTKKEKAELLEKGENFCLGAIEALFKDAIQLRDFESANVWRREYSGALKMLAALRLISEDEYEARKEDMWDRYMKEKYPKACLAEET